MANQFRLACKLLGVYFLISAFMALLTLFQWVSWPERQQMSGVIVIVTIVNALFLAIVAYVLMVRTERVLAFVQIGDTPPAPSIHEPLVVGIILIGVYMFSMNIGQFIFAIVQSLSLSNPYGSMEPRGFTYTHRLLEEGATVVASVLLMIYASRLGRLLSQKNES